MNLSLPLFLALALPTLAADSWQGFRGSHGTGHADASNLPVTWSESQNVKWKTPIPHRGWSTPLILGNQIWLTTATEDGHDFFALCLDRSTGAIIHESKLFHADKPEPLANDLNCYASPPAGSMKDASSSTSVPTAPPASTPSPSRKSGAAPTSPAATTVAPVPPSSTGRTPSS
jgi:hypothetical protein